MDDPECLRLLHGELLDGDDTAPARLAEWLRPVLVAHLRARFQRPAERDCIEGAVDEALISYIKDPKQYEPGRGGLLAYLKMAASGDLKNARRRNRRYEKNRVAGVELDQLGGNESRADQPARRLWDAELRTELERLFPDARDRAVVELLAEGERSTEAFARALGLAEQPAPQLRAEVKRHKDRIKKKLRRYGDSIRERE